VVVTSLFRHVAPSSFFAMNGSPASAASYSSCGDFPDCRYQSALHTNPTLVRVRLIGMYQIQP